mmetsp:Transcript_10657/g.43095  ORF Transcript_10657/g.43095 Transcript_10657/m.43095 type:complete len:277 (-) Transcript_10657:352-1182(-)
MRPRRPRSEGAPPIRLLLYKRTGPLRDEVGADVGVEEGRDRGAAVDAADGALDEFADGELSDLARALGHVGSHGHRVGDDDFFEDAGLDAVGGGPREQPVRGEGEDAGRAEGLELVGGGRQRTGGVDHVVDDDAVRALDVAYQVHRADDARRGALLEDDGERDLGRVGEPREALHEQFGARDAARVGAHDDGSREILQVEVRDRDRGCVEVVDGRARAEKALDLRAVQVDREHAVDAHGLHHRRDVGARDGHAHAARLVRLPRVRVVREHGRHGGR